MERIVEDSQLTRVFLYPFPWILYVMVLGVGFLVYTNFSFLIDILKRELLELFFIMKAGYWLPGASTAVIGSPVIGFYGILRVRVLLVDLWKL